MDSSGAAVDCVFLSCLEYDVRCFAIILGQSRIRLHSATSLEIADFLLIATGALVLVTDTNFADGTWQDALAMTRSLHRHVATLICADEGERGALAGARERGAIDVLPRPVAIERLRAAIRSANDVMVKRLKLAGPTPRLASL